MNTYKIALGKLKQAGIEAKEGVDLSIQLTDGKKVKAKITSIDKEYVIASTG
jgi:sRNA-binding regulator protein Hfq